MASLAACSTEGADTLVRPYRRGIGLSRGRWVKGAKAGWKAGRRLESLPHNTEIGKEGADTMGGIYAAAA
jgi:hypothetical protein